jgi:uncharacterized cupin superfamily protein
VISHWDEAETERAELGHIAGSWTDLGSAAGSVEVGLNRIRVDPGKWSTPAHQEGAEEEIFFVLAGSGISRLNGVFHEVRAGDCLVHLARGGTHTLKAGDEGLDVLAFGERIGAQIGYLPRANVAWIGGTWVDAGAEPWPWQREVDAGEPEIDRIEPRPPSIVNVDDVEDDNGWRDLGRAAGSVRTGVSRVTVAPRELSAKPHCHSAEEELFVILEGDGTLELTPSPTLVELGSEPAQHPVRAGHVVSRPAGTRMAHAFRAGEGGMTLLAYGQRNSNDIAYYPRSNKISWRGVGVRAILDHVTYEFGEESPR